MNRLRSFPCQGTQVSENPIVHLMEQVHVLGQEAVTLQETVRDFDDTVSSLEALRCTDLQMQGVMLGLEGKRTADGCKI